MQFHWALQPVHSLIKPRVSCNEDMTDPGDIRPLLKSRHCESVKIYPITAVEIGFDNDFEISRNTTEMFSV